MSKPNKALEQDGFGNKMKYHFHVTTVHKYQFFVLCLYSSNIYLHVCWVVTWKWYFILLPNPSCSCAFFGFDIYHDIFFHFLKIMFSFIILVLILFLNNLVNCWSNTWWLFCFIYSTYWYFLREWCPERDSIQNLLQYYNIHYYNSYILFHFWICFYIILVSLLFLNDSV